MSKIRRSWIGRADTPVVVYILTYSRRSIPTEPQPQETPKYACPNCKGLRDPPSISNFLNTISKNHFIEDYQSSKWDPQNINIAPPLAKETADHPNQERYCKPSEYAH